MVTTQIFLALNGTQMLRRYDIAGSSNYLQTFNYSANTGDVDVNNTFTLRRMTSKGAIYDPLQLHCASWCCSSSDLALCHALCQALNTVPGSEVRHS